MASNQILKKEVDEKVSSAIVDWVSSNLNYIFINYLIIRSLIIGSIFNFNKDFRPKPFSCFQILFFCMSSCTSWAVKMGLTNLFLNFLGDFLRDSCLWPNIFLVKNKEFIIIKKYLVKKY